MAYRYAIYNLVIETPFPCPLLAPAPQGFVPDVVVAEGEVPTNLANPASSGSNWVAAPGQFLLRGGLKSGRFLVEDGQRITLQKNPAAEDARLAVNFVAAALTALLQQRGMLVLHANTALIGQNAVAICGESGSGKTTTIAGVLARGNKLLADDITVAQIRHDGVLEILPGAPQLHLCEDTAAQFGFDISGIPRYPWRRMKAAMPVQAIMAQSPAALKAIYLLRTVSCGEVSTRILSGMEKFDALQECIYGPLLPESHERLFPLFSAITEQVDMCLLERPAGRWTLEQMVEVIVNG